ncbi:ATP-dependent helicase HrpB [Planctomicrobium sp. SH664]|uniref:ATP-dependent helicase HrpB n=1 Tax=Planctomicrobium sp. SH664 TaxID=3448125 RepID=UPI003F5CBCAB
MTHPDPLPIDDVLPELITGLKQQSSAVLRAPTGAGKTTRVPPALLQAGLAGNGQIVMLQPRRLAARSTARRIAVEQRATLGREVGYQVRFDARSSRETRMLVVTEGILLNRLQRDPFLDGIQIVVFDEFHERNLDSDLALGMVRRIQQTVRPDLKIVVMSATLDPAPLVAYLQDAAAVESLGKSYPVEIRYLKQRDTRPLPEVAAEGAQLMFGKTTGDVLVFLPGVGEIHRTARELEAFARKNEAELFLLYGDMPAEEQDRVLNWNASRKIVLATNVAETSITIPGITAVVDTGMARVMRFDPQAGLDRLELEPISQASADQRAGRAGRTQPGICLRLWDEVAQRHRPPFTDPEIRRVDLAGPVLQLKTWGEHEVLQFPWLEPPRADAVTQAELLLRRLDALNEQNEVTALGRTMCELPVHPRLARLLLESRRLGVPREGAWLAALLSERNPFFQSRQGPPRLTPSHQRQHSRSDVLDRLLALMAAEQKGETEFPFGTLNRQSARMIQQSRDQLTRLIQELFQESTETAIDAEEALLRSLVRAFPDRVARRRDVGSEKGLMVGGRGVKLAPASEVRQGALFLCVDVDAGQTDALVRQASAVEPDWLPQNALRASVEVFFHPSTRQVVARRREYFEDLILSETPAALPDNSEPAELLFREALKEWDQIFPSQTPEVTGFLARLRSLAQWMPELGLPQATQPELEVILRQLCQRCRSFAELKKADWVEELRQLLDWSQQQILDREAPLQWRAPSGRSIPFHYEEGRPPVLAVKIQEIFGLEQTPRIAGGRVTVLMHLLAPNMRPQQVTDDLSSFWTNTYPVVKKELARRYPKHSWPDDPRTAKPGRKEQK